MADEEDGKPTMSAECRVEALPLSGADISIEGLRLRLDIRILPRSKEDAASGDTAALFRVVTARISRASEMPAYQWVAVMLGVGVLLVAVTLWIAGTGAAPSGPARGLADAPAPSAPPGRVAASKSEQANPPSVAAPTTPMAAESNAPPSVGVSVPAPQAPASAVPAPRIQSVDVSDAQPSRRSAPPRNRASSARTAAAPPPPVNVSPQPVAQRPAAREDMLDLFGDTK